MPKLQLFEFSETLTTFPPSLCMVTWVGFIIHLGLSSPQGGLQGCGYHGWVLENGGWVYQALTQNVTVQLGIVLSCLLILAFLCSLIWGQ